MSKISVTILTKNSAQNIQGALMALTSFDEVVVLDTGSEDETPEIAAQFPNVSVHHHPFNGFGPSHNKATSLAKNDWILSIDSDEIVSSELVREIRSTELDEKTVCAIPRCTYFNEKFIKWCGWYPDYVWRLYNRKVTRFTDVRVHEKVMTKGLQKVKLRNPIRHYSYETTKDFLAKMQTYSDLYAQQYKGKRKSSLCKAVLHGGYAFFKSYLLKRGFLGGREGFIISVYNGNSAFYKYLKLAEANKEFYRQSF